MQAHAAYRRHSQTAWTRIDMLLALYNSTIDTFDNGIDILNRQDLENYPPIQIRASEHLLLLIDGIDAESSEIGSRIRDLCVFCIGQIAAPDVQSWVHAREILATLRDGFESIREEGIQLEANGTVPPLSLVTSQTVLHA